MNPEPRARVGVSSWDRPNWVRHFYPQGVARSRWLRYAAERMPTLEINSTFYGLRRPSDFLAWRDAVPEDVVFAVKAFRGITHERRLRGVADELARFFATGVPLLQEKLGPILWQVPPSLGYEPRLVDEFLALLPHSVDELRHLVSRQGLELDPALRALGDRPLRHCFEARNGGFRHPSFIELLRRHDVAAVTTNAPGWPLIDAVTSDFAYARLHTGATHYPDGYDDAELDRWAAWAGERLSGVAGGAGRDVFAYFENPEHDTTSSPFDAIELQRRVGGAQRGTDASVQLPLWGL